MTTPITHWYDRVLTQCPGLDENMFTVALHTVMREYFRDSWAWQDDIVFTATAGQDSFDLDTYYKAPVDTFKRVAQIHGVHRTDDGFPLRPLTRPWFSMRYRENARPYWWADQPNVLRVSEPFSSDTELAVNVHVQPANGIDNVPAFVQDHHDDAITAGLLAHFMVMPAKPWTNPTAALYHQNDYRQRTAEARAVAERAYTPADAQWVYPRSFV